MNSNANFEIAHNFHRANTNLPKPHPMRGYLLTRSEREMRRHQQLEDDNKRGGKRLLCDIAIMAMGIVSAFVPMAIAFNSVMGN